MDYKLVCWTEFKRVFYYKTGLRKLAEHLIIPWKRYDKITSISIEEMLNIIKENNIELIIIDMDGTLKHYTEGLLRTHKEWVKTINKYVKIHIITNSSENYAKEIASELEVPYLCSAKKPLPIGFKKILDVEHVDKTKTILIGDATVTDILGAHNAGIDKTILVDDISVKKKVKMHYKW